MDQAGLTAAQFSPEFPALAHKLINELPWRYPPKFPGLLAPEKWCLSSVKNPVLISLSTYFQDDFGVSVAQAQSKGWPCILSNWGGHQDVMGSNTLKLPHFLCGTSDEPPSVQEGRALAIAREIHDWIKKAESQDTVNVLLTSRPKLRLPTPLITTEIVDRISNAQSQHDYDICFAGKSERTETTVVVSSQQKHTWQSMGEIVPAIEKAWAASASPNHAVKFLLNTNLYGLNARIASLRGADRVVFTSFRLDFERQAWVMSLFRHYLNKSVPFLIHLHGDGATGLTELMTVSDVLRNSDIFIAACSADLRALRHCLPQVSTRVVPFALADPDIAHVKRAKKSSTTLVYAGRISEQKNLHTLLIALWLLKQRGLKFLPKLEVFGSSDNLGSPLIGYFFRDYGSYLRRLAKQLDLSSQITWHGEVPRNQLKKILRSFPHTFISPSIHSDENFGAAAFYSLSLGNSAILSAWGGHLDFSQHIRNQVQLVPVRASEAGPVINPFVLAAAIASYNQKMGAKTSLKWLCDYKPTSVATKFGKITTSRQTGRSSPLRISPLLSEIEKKRKLAGLSLSASSSRAYNRSRKVFSGYEDRTAEPFLKAYGMTSTFTRLTGKELLLMPWVSISNSVIKITDPYRGVFKISPGRRTEQKVQVTSTSGRSYFLAKSAACSLVEMGVLFSGTLPTNQ